MERGADSKTLLEINDIICVTESWMDTNECELIKQEFNVDFNIIYSCRKKDKRAKRDSGGIILFVRNRVRI